MKNVELISPNGKATVFAHPTKVKQMLESGWKEKTQEIVNKPLTKEGKRNG